MGIIEFDFDFMRFRVQEASGSNPDTPTIEPVTAFVVAGFLISSENGRAVS